MNRTPSTKKTGKRERQTDRMQSARGQIIHNVCKIANDERIMRCLSRCACAGSSFDVKIETDHNDAVEIKTEADSNDVTEYPDYDRPSIGTFDDLSYPQHSFADITFILFTHYLTVTLKDLENALSRS